MSDLICHQVLSDKSFARVAFRELVVLSSYYCCALRFGPFEVFCNSLKYYLYEFPGFLAGGGNGYDSDGEGKLAMPNILASLTKEQRKELAALRVDEKKWKKEDRRKKRKKRKSRRDEDSGESSDEVNDKKEKQHRHKHRSHKSRKTNKSDAQRSDRGRHRKHHNSDGSSSEIS